jgi:hypothetical protein
VHCKQSAWSKWGACSKPCKGGVQKSTRFTLVGPRYGGKACGKAKRHRKCNQIPCPGDCWTTAWTSWSKCSKMCGTGIQKRVRKVKRKAKKGGVPCGALKQSRKCNTTMCGIHCKPTPWSPWSPCSRKCNTGAKFRTRKVTVFNSATGETITLENGNGKIKKTDTKHYLFHMNPRYYAMQACGASSEQRSCNTKRCGVDCKVSGWSEWGDCSKACGTGVAQRSRMIEKAPKYGGKVCPPLTEKRKCKTQPCAVHCRTSDWAAWSSCSKKCGGGSMKRMRTITVKPKHNGRGCGILHEERKCNTAACPVDCKVSRWTLWTRCTKSCGGGRQSRKRKATQQPMFGGKQCPHLHDQRACNTLPCPVHCQVYGFGDWGRCSKPCGGGKQTRIRAVAIPSKHGGRNCPPLQQSRACNKHHCPIPCKTSAWTKWDKCSKTCGTGIQSHFRKVTQKPKYKGRACGKLKGKRKCNSHHCPIHCKVSKWAQWGKCSKKCGGGEQFRKRTVKRHDKHGGRACPALSQKRPCHTFPCKIHCKVSKFGPFGKCSQQCGGGLKVRARVVTTHPKYGGKACPALEHKQPCNVHPCPVDCVVSKWSAPGQCSKPCGGGLAGVVRTAIQPALHGGRKCPPLKKDVPCNNHPCPVHCKTSLWFPWSKCSQKCGGGSQRRSRSVNVKPRFGGRPCGTLKQTRACNTKPCAIHCKTSKWGKWAKCSKSCGGGETKRFRKITMAPKHGGKSCGLLLERKSCGTKPCPVDCKMKKWSSWGRCSVKCGGGVQSRARGMKVEPKYGGKPCGALLGRRKCNKKPCPIHCEVSDWGPPGKCSKTCGGGKAVQRRTVITRVQHGGRKCPPLKKSVTCNAQHCPVNCAVSKWGKPLACSRACGGGFALRSRKIKVRPRYGGKACPALKQSLACNTRHCPVNCSTGPYGAWTRCSKTCGGGSQIRTRNIRKPAQYGGARCPHLVQKRRCNKVSCPQNCKLQSWGPYNKCSKACGGGTQSRTRGVISLPKHGGKACGTLQSARKCNVIPCATTCEAIFMGGKFNKCARALRKRISDGRAQCAKKKHDFILTSTTSGEGKCTPNVSNIQNIDLKSGSSKLLTLQKRKHSVLQGRLQLSCPVSMNSKITPKEVRQALPYSVCLTTRQRICTGLEKLSTACAVISATKCLEVCVHAKYCKNSTGKVVNRRHGWRSPGGTACCFKDCKIPRPWYASDGSPLEPSSWCHQTNTLGRLAQA